MTKPISHVVKFKPSLSLSNADFVFIHARKNDNREYIKLFEDCRIIVFQEID